MSSLRAACMKRCRSLGYLHMCWSEVNYKKNITEDGTARKPREE